MINLSVPNLSMDILDNLKECLESGWVSTGGRFIPEFETKVKNYMKTMSINYHFFQIIRMEKY